MTDESIAAEPDAWLWRCKPYCEWPKWSVSIRRQADSGCYGGPRTEGYEDIPLYRASPEVLRASSGSMSEAEERVAFEKWVKRKGAFLSASTDRYHDGDYMAGMTRDQWTAWKARAALSPSGPMISLNAVAAGPSGPSQDQSTRDTELLFMLEALVDQDAGYDDWANAYNCGVEAAIRTTKKFSALAAPQQSDFRVLKRDEGPTADAATGTGNTQGTEP